jgi:hypothetical protein
MSDARYLIRIAHSGSFQPLDQADLLSKARALMVPIKGKAINLRVSRSAIELDLFIAPEEDVNRFVSVLKRLGKVITCKRLDVPPPPIDPPAIVSEARRLFNEQRFWEVHEVLEGLWKEVRGTEKQLVQGLILVAAALVHVQKNEWPPVWTMLADALQRLEGQPEAYYGWDVAKFRKQFAHVLGDKKIEFPTV